MDGRSHGTRLNCSPPFVGLQAHKFGGVFINARPRAPTRKTSPFDLLLTLRRFFYREEIQFLSRRSLLLLTTTIGMRMRRGLRCFTAYSKSIYFAFWTKHCKQSCLPSNRGAWTRTWLFSLI